MAQAYFTLREGKLSYFKEEPPKSGSKVEPIGVLNLSDVTHIKSDKDLKRDDLCLQMITPSREFMMRCGNKVEYSEWRKIVDSHIAYVKLVSRGELTDPVKEAARLEAEEIAEVYEVFDDLDIDGDGQLSEGEIEAAVHQVLER